jgi:hypothetical protein
VYQVITAAVAGGLATLGVEYFLHVVPLGLLASLAGLLFVATLCAVVLINLVSARTWERIPRFPAIPSRLLPFLFLGGLIAGFLLGWLYW